MVTKTDSSLIVHDGGTIKDALDKTKPIADYVALRAYTGSATQVRITSNGIAGFFYYDASDTSSTDNGGTVIVSSNGKRWKRNYTGNINVKWFGAKGDGLTIGTDNTSPILLAISAMGNTGTLDFDPGVYLTSPIDLRSCRNFTIRGANETTLGPWLSSNSTVIKIRSGGDVGIKTATVDEMPVVNYGKNIKIKNLYLDCNHLVTTGINCLQGTTIEGVEVRYAQQDGIVLEQTSYPVNIRDTVSAQNGRDGLRAKAQFTTSYTLTNVECRQNNGNGFTLHAGFTSVFNYCLAQSNTGDGFAIELFDPVASGYTYPVYLAGMVFISCYSEANGGWGFRTNSYSNNPAAYVGKINDLTFITSSFNSGINQKVQLRGLANANFINSPYLSDAYDPLYNTVAIDNVIVQGSITPKYEVDLTSPTAGKIRFPSVQIPSSDPNILDDYEEGTFTARISQQHTNYFTTSGTTTARYQKIGNVVTCFVDYSWSDKGVASAGYRAIFDNLPYTAAFGGPASAAACSIRVAGGSTDHWMIWVQSSTKEAYFIKNNNTGAGAVISDLPDAGTLTATFSYVTST